MCYIVFKRRITLKYITYHYSKNEFFIEPLVSEKK